MVYNYNKDEILTKINTNEALNRYLKPFHNYASLKQGQHISNPFLSHKQRTPSFNIYESSQGTWRYKDFATGDDGDIIDLIMKLKGIDFKEALHALREDFSLVDENNSHRAFEICFLDWNIDNANFWDTYNIKKETLIKFDVLPVDFFKRSTRSGKFSRVKSTQDNPIYAYKIGRDCYKIYQPYSKKFKFSWLGEKHGEYVFGLKKLPETGKVVFITGGEKDVLSLSANGHSAICLNSETAFPSEELIQDLKQRFEDVVLLYDIDETGIKQSKKIAKDYELKRLLLPNDLKKKGGKDVSDFFKYGFEFKYEKLTVECFSKNNESAVHLSLLLDTQKRLKKRKSERIKKTEPILTQNELPIIFPRTINIIQGKAGVHKSRLAETLCSVFIRHPECNNNHLGFKTNILKRPIVCYVDTERNLTEQFPYAIQQIIIKAGYSISDDPFDLDYISLLEVSRKERFQALTEYLNHVRKKFSGHLVVILDVVTDCIKDFNRSEDSMQLVDLMNLSINKYNVTFIGLIHENPGSIDKARGHLGTELMNKSTTVMQVGFEKGKNGKPTDLITLNFLKARSTKRIESIYLEYCDKSNGLVLADENRITDVIQSRQLKAEIPEVISFLEEFLLKPTSNSDLLDMLSKEFDCSTKIIRGRLKEIYENKNEIIDKNNISSYLNKSKQGKEIYYSLQPISDN
jgi:hypothetical protein